MRKKSTEMNEILITNLDDCVMRKVPCVVTSFRSPESLNIMVINVESTQTLENVSKTLHNIYTPILGGAEARDKWVAEMHRIMQRAIAGETFNNILDDLNHYGVIHTERGFQRVDILHEESNGNYLAEFIDYGDVITVAKDKIYPLAKSLLNFKRCNVLCKLVDVGETNPAKLRKFQELITSRTGWYVLIINKQNGIYNIGLSTPDKSIKMNSAIADIAEQVDEYFGPMESFYESLDTIINEDDPESAVHGFRIDDDAKICQLFRENGTCFKKNACRKLHIACDPQKLTNLSEPAFFHAPVLPALSTEREYQVSAVYLSEMGQIFVRVAEDRDDYELEFRQMTNLMNRPDMIMKYEPVKGLPCQGEIVLCLAKGKYLRGTVSHFLDDTTVLVNLVDFGRCFDAKVCDLRAMPTGFLKLPFQARPVLLEGYEIVARNLQEFEKIFRKTLPWFLKPMFCYEHSQLVNIYNRKGHNVAHSLMAAGIVRKRKIAEPSDAAFSSIMLPALSNLSE